MVIKSFATKQTQNIYLRRVDKMLPAEVQQAALRKLRMQNNANSIQDLRSPPGNRLEKWKGDRLGRYSIRTNDRWRVCFEWRNDSAYAVEIVDYH